MFATNYCYETNLQNLQQTVILHMKAILTLASVNSSITHLARLLQLCQGRCGSAGAPGEALLWVPPLVRFSDAQATAKRRCCLMS